MTVSIPRTKSASFKALLDLTRAFRGRPPRDFVEFLKVHDGADFGSNVFFWGEGEADSVHDAVPAANMLKERDKIDRFPKFGVPFANSDLGDIFYIDTGNHKVYLWDHELQQPNWLADNFSDFLTNLQPDDDHTLGNEASSADSDLQHEAVVEGLTGNGRSDVRKANQAAGLPATPRGYVWHHVEDMKTMLLVPHDVHKSVAHLGGRTVIRNGGFDA